MKRVINISVNHLLNIKNRFTYEITNTNVPDYLLMGYYILCFYFFRVFINIDKTIYILLLLLFSISIFYILSKATNTLFNLVTIIITYFVFRILI